MNLIVYEHPNSGPFESSIFRQYYFETPSGMTVSPPVDGFKPSRAPILKTIAGTTKIYYSKDPNGIWVAILEIPIWFLTLLAAAVAGTVEIQRHRRKHTAEPGGDGKPDPVSS